jgi:predicted component of type VI protein secretion system
MFKLTFHRGSLSGKTLKISTPQIILGRSRESCDVWLDDDGVSREHCRIEQRDDGIYITDLDSRNGTWVNRQKITEQRLATGDDVRIGPVKLTFEMVETVPLHHEVETSPLSTARRSLSLASLLAFLRTSYGGVFVGLSIGTGIALLLLFLLQKPREQVADTEERKTQTLRNTFAGNNDFSHSPLDRNAPRRQPPIPADQPPQEQLGQNDPDPPKADNAPAIERKDSETPPIQGEARIITGFDSSYPRKVARAGENHFTIDMEGSRK